MEQLVILLVIGAISLANWLIKRSAELREKRKFEGKDRPVPARSERRPEEEADPGESMRKLMEALGLPVEEPPPKLPRREAPPVPIEPSAPPPLPQSPPTARRRTPAVPATPSPATAPMAEAAAFEKKLENYAREVEAARKILSLSPARPAVKAAQQKSGRYRKLLSSQASARDAIVLAEILGTPKALR